MRSTPSHKCCKKSFLLLQDSNWSSGNPHTAFKLCDLLQPNMGRFGSRYAKCTHSQIIVSKHECFGVFSSNLIPPLLRQLDTSRLPSSVPQLIKDIHLLHTQMLMFIVSFRHTCAAGYPCGFHTRGGGGEAQKGAEAAFCEKELRSF